MARGTIVREEERLVLWFVDGRQYLVDPGDAAAVLRGYAVPAPFVRSSRFFEMVVAYAEKHAGHLRRGDRAEPAIDDWDRHTDYS